MTEEIKLKQIKNAKEIIGVLETLGIKPFLWAGSLLGAIREKAIITGDSDVDIAYVSNFHDAKGIIDETKELYRQLAKRGLLYDYLDEEFQNRGPEDIGTVFGQVHLGTEFPHLDMFTMWTVGEDFYDTWFGPVAKNVDTTVESDALELNGVMFPSIKNPTWVLEMLYGTDWKTPRQDKATNRNAFRHTLKEFRVSSGIIY